ncbi:MAG TPA: CocE/NonD family hydrolase [Gemmatimonadales bacterium]|nr:CocE/NonD family hydrolase [Gemmatimonadales bacterium]
MSPRPVRGMRFLLIVLALGAGTAPPLPAQAGVRVDSAVAIPMRDGITLAAEVWRPAAGERFPVLVYRTPYGRLDAADVSGVARSAVERGYVVVLQDVRGRYGSAGEFEPYRHEGRDGYDTIEWAARQPWSTGSVGTFGLSYPGAVQWLAAVESPPSLKAMVPAMTYATPETFWYAGGVWDGSWLDWTWLSIAPDLRRRLNRPGPKTDDEAATAWQRESERARRHRPLGTLPDFQGVAPWYYEWMRHPPCDPWWSWATLDGRYDRTNAAVLNLSGWFDEQYGPYGAVTNYQGVVRARTRSADGPRAALVLGPWTHGVRAVGSSSAGDRQFGASAALDYAKLVLDWMDRHLKPTSASVPDNDAPVRVFVMGANQWRDAALWPLPGTRGDTLYLQSTSHRDAPGRLGRTAPRGGDGWSVLRSDPVNPLSDPFGGAAGAHDYRSLPGRPGTVTFETAPFAQAYDAIGPVFAELAVSASVPDFDLWLQLYDVAPDGTAWNLSAPGSGLVRTRYRAGGPEQQLVRPGEMVRLRFDRTITANRFLAGHRLRVVVSAAFFPLFSLNPQTGDQEFDTDAVRSGEVRIHHSATARSAIILPAVPVRE